ncbi:MAG: diacylglycerol kinase family lipid kinase [Caldilineaceae bacterium]|nr:diacylglycerol kinase family lipid kinase [Caldilineaceae bacterium]
MKAVQVILNPSAGSGAGARAKEPLVAALTTAGLSFELTETTRQGHALELAAAMRANGCQVVVAAGGDGTVNEVLNGLAQATPDGELIGRLATYPIGTGNDFSDMAGAKRGLEALAERIAAGRTRRVDMGRGIFTSQTREVVRYFDNNVGLGFEAQVTVDSNRIRWVSGPVRYLVAVFKALRHYRSPHVEVAWENAAGMWQERAQPALMISLGNSRRTGGLFYVNPDAVMDDGLLDLAIVPDKSLAQILWLLPQTFSGAHRNDPTILFDRCVQLKLTSARPIPVHLDGEVIMDDVRAARVEILPCRLEIVV